MSNHHAHARGQGPATDVVPVRKAHSGPRPWGVVVVLAAALALLTASQAEAHEGEEALPARDFVQQAIGLLRSQPDQTELIADKINDAMSSADTDGVDLELVRQADEAFQAGDLQGTQDLLAMSIAATPVMGSSNASPSASAEPGMRTTSAVVHEPDLSTASQLPGPVGMTVLLGIALILVAGGLILARRLR